MVPNTAFSQILQLLQIAAGVKAAVLAGNIQQRSIVPASSPSFPG
jgi:hypothetical protein